MPHFNTQLTTWCNIAQPGMSDSAAAVVTLTWPILSWLEAHSAIVLQCPSDWMCAYSTTTLSDVVYSIAVTSSGRMRSHHWPLAAALLTAYIACVDALNNGLARTPHMGYNTWNCFAGDSRCRMQCTADLSTADQMRFRLEVLLQSTRTSSSRPPISWSSQAWSKQVMITWSLTVGERFSWLNLSLG